jgi:hypothetical protein
MPDKTEKKTEQVKGLIAYAPFEYGDKLYKTGDIFAPPAGLVRDPDFDAFRASEKKHAALDEKTGTGFVKPDGKRIILPVQEA